MCYYRRNNLHYNNMIQWLVTVKCEMCHAAPTPAYCFWFRDKATQNLIISADINKPDNSVNFSEPVTGKDDVNAFSEFVQYVFR